MPTFEREVCQRLPLADAVLQLLQFCTPDDFLTDLFGRLRHRSYEDLLTFPQFVHLLRDALLGRQRSAYQHFCDAQDDGTLPTGVRALYGKLQRLPLPLSQGFLLEATARLCQVGPAASDPLPTSLDDLDVLAFDGKKLKYVAKRLKALRPLRGQLLGGKLLVVQQVRTGLALACQADADGEAADNGLVAGAVAQVRQQTGGTARLWVGDRLFCDLQQWPVLTADGDHVLLRYQSKVGFHVDAQRPAQTGRDARGLSYTEDWGWLGAASRRDRVYVRRITLSRPNAAAIVVVTDLLDAMRYPAADLLDAYLRRWGIEKLFQRVTEVFDLRHLIGGSPQATVFQAAFCLLLSNVIQLVRGYVAAAQQRAPETISVRLLFDDVSEELTIWHHWLDVPQTLAWLGEQVWTAAQVRAYLQRRLATVWRERWHKAPTKSRPAKGPTQYLQGGHSSVHRVLHGQHKVRSDPDDSSG
jgi:hypothetical protein